MRQPLLPIQRDTKWHPPSELPQVRGRMKRVGVDFETTGTDVYGSDVPIGLAVYLEDGRKMYLPWGHASGNLDKGLVVNWAQTELQDLEISFAEAKFDIEMGRKVGIDFEKQRCKPREIQFRASLCDDHRRSVKLDVLAHERLGKQKLPMMGNKIWTLPANEVGPYAEEDVELTYLIDKDYEKEIRDKDLGRVLELEDSLIYCTLEMERNGALLDLPKLNRWRHEVSSLRQRGYIELGEQLGFKVNPDSGKDMERIFKHLDIQHGETALGTASFPDIFLKTVMHPTVQLARRCRVYSSLLSKYLDNYWKKYSDTGIMRYRLHQLKGEDFGTTSGRYSSSKDNIQQVFDPERQAEKLGTIDWLVRELFIPPPGRFWFKADASQIEFRLFAHYSKSARLIRAYLENPDIDFHEQVAQMISRRRKFAKNINFGKLYGMGIGKMGRQMGVGEEEARELVQTYDQAFPEARTLMNFTMGLAERRGYVKTILGRIATFPDKMNLHKALNRVIQGAAADVLKMKLLELYNHRKEFDLTMRFTVHDEVDGDIPEESVSSRLKELLDSPILNIRVPLIWDCKTGASWNL